MGDERDEFGEIIVSDESELTPFQNVDVEADAAKFGMAPEDESRAASESLDIKNQLEGIRKDNESRAPVDKVSVSPEDVN